VLVLDEIYASLYPCGMALALLTVRWDGDGTRGEQSSDFAGAPCRYAIGVRPSEVKTIHCRGSVNEYSIGSIRIVANSKSPTRNSAIWPTWSLRADALWF
jgi:hypothetical protein